jgi:hypothetical protein
VERDLQICFAKVFGELEESHKMGGTFLFCDDEINAAWKTFSLKLFLEPSLLFWEMHKEALRRFKEQE